MVGCFFEGVFFAAWREGGRVEYQIDLVNGVVSKWFQSRTIIKWKCGPIHNCSQLASYWSSSELHPPPRFLSSSGKRKRRCCAERKRTLSTLQVIFRLTFLISSLRLKRFPHNQRSSSQMAPNLTELNLNGSYNQLNCTFPWLQQFSIPSFVQFKFNPVHKAVTGR